jgi:hypothetical protein
MLQTIKIGLLLGCVAVAHVQAAAASERLAEESRAPAEPAASNRGFASFEFEDSGLKVAESIKRIAQYDPSA